ncbi:MAG: efflux RND transporter periplasmic adaptor subunit [Bacteroidales bacterium]|nr:efflux RND transporter periplasmic adaptor subunit [Bacteroidales bacterium]
MMKKKGIIIALAVVAAALAAWLILKPSGKTVLTLERGKVSRITITNSVSATGTVEPVTEVEVGTQVSGIIDKLYVDYNDEVKAGQVIAEMDKVTLQAELESAQSTLTSSKTEYDYRLKEYNRAKTLHEKELISDADYDLAVYNYEKALSAYKQAQASMVKVKRNLGYATITSPIDGVVISRAVEEGQTVAAGFSTPTLFVIANDLTKMQVIADVDEADIGQVKEGQDVEFSVDAYPDDTFAGLVQQVRLEPTTSSNVVTYQVVITADNPELKLLPGLTANVTIYTVRKEDVLSVQTKALRFTPDAEQMAGLGFKVAGEAPAAGKHVWVIEGDTLRPRSVETGSVMSDRTEITEGLTGEETVAAALTVVSAAQKSTARSPFMPARPGGNSNKKQS